MHVNIDGAPSSKRHDMGVGLWMDFLCANSMIPHEQLYDTKLALNVRVFGVSIIHGGCYGGCEWIRLQIRASSTNWIALRREMEQIRS